MSAATTEVMTTRFPTDALPPSPPVHPVPLKEVGVFYGAQNYRNLTNEGNLNGYNNEVKVGSLISTVDFVKAVRQVEPRGGEDSDLTDLVVTMVDGYPLEHILVQVKSGTESVYDFFDKVGKRLNVGDPKRDKSNGDLEYQRRRDWMKARRLMVINGGVKKSGPVTDEYILEKFMREVELIIEYEE